ncbi:hypothetical protein ATPR_1572 [Acetobacter tropicalis NBRC 101654]|uniref:Uncharacterized protein n=1 Tax=Acetobacter tropicalis NBRC 101654 TaxID=749388 RepID=F7VDX4_9PROT|nr:hypothetical protein ATPR_1572 [Acetobacter tropicalis NBRC 101654]
MASIGQQRQRVREYAPQSFGCQIDQIERDADGKSCAKGSRRMNMMMAKSVVVMVVASMIMMVIIIMIAPGSMRVMRMIMGVEICRAMGLFWFGVIVRAGLMPVVQMIRLILMACVCVGWRFSACWRP